MKRADTPYEHLYAMSSSSSSQAYGHHPGIYTSEPLPNLDANNVTTQWYTPTQYAFDNSYLTPLPSSGGVEDQPWVHLARSTGPETPMPQYAVQPQAIQVPQFQTPFKDASRPRSSPSTFGPTSEGFLWPVTSGLGIYSSGSIGQPTPVTSTFPPTVFQPYPSDDQYVKDELLPKDESQQQQQPTLVASPPELQQPQPRRPYASIAPDPVGIATAQKRKRDDEDAYTDISLSGKKRKRTSSVASTDLSEDDRLLVTLKEEQNLPWKEIAARYSVEKGKQVQVAALQMRYKRLREKHRVWTDQDLNALKQAYDIWEKNKWDNIAQGMLDFGLVERWNPKQIARKWQELEMQAVSMATSVGLTPAMSQFSTSQFSSPIEAPAHYAWLPLS